MASLKKKHKEFIIKQLACYHNPTDVQDELRKNFDIDVSLSQIVYYNPETARACNLAEKWRTLFYNIRQKFVDGLVDIPIANKRYRLQVLQQTLALFRSQKNPYGMMEALEQAAKEMGGIYEQSKVLPPSTGDINFYQQINQKINQVNEKKNGIT